ncbi:MAG: efflux RND transporter periplasmic adaptor subunit [Myxococcales bacterium]|nr:efflux RND transporter periplasmic adaptor subunit [Myxococcales bacterium]
MSILLVLAAACGRKDRASYRTEPVTRGPIAEVVNATGDVSAIVTVNVGSQVSGIIDKLYVDFNSKVKKGQVLATLDPRLFQAQLEKADAQLESAKANVEKAQASLVDSERILKRDLELRAGNLIAQADVDTASATRDANKAGLSASKAAVLQAKADRDMAATNLAFARITSPIDGIVVSRNVDVGQTVAAAFQAPTLFLIANDLTKMQILANIDEADVGKVHEGAEAKFTVDAYPGETFTGSIREVRQAPTTIQNVVTYAAVIDAPNPDRKLRQGMTASVTITTARKDDVMRVSNAALRFRPEESGATEAAPQQQPQRGAGGGQPMARGATAASRGRPEGAPAQQSGPGRPGRVYKVDVGGKPNPVNIRVDLSDGQRTEVLDGLAEGDKVIVGEAGAGGSQPRPQRRGPF